MDRALERDVRRRAADACEYCQLPARLSPLSFPIDHIRARQHGGDDSTGNLALACHFCNAHKGPNIAGFDPATSKLTRLFHPRRDRRTKHFAWKSPKLIGLTAVGRTTIVVLAMNHPVQIATRAALATENGLGSE